MNRNFQRLIDSLDPSFQQLIAMEPVRCGRLPRKMPQSGVYLFTEEDEHLYVGRSNSLRNRINIHGRPSAGQNNAAFAFRLASEAMGRTSATYKTEGSRASLESDPIFNDTFLQAKERVSKMEVRFVEEQNQLQQALLEIYVAVALSTPYNTFGTY